MISFSMSFSNKKKGGMEVFLVIFIISLVVATIIVNSAYQLFMKVIGARGMFFSAKKKLTAIFVVALLLTSICAQILGITPK